MGRYFLLCKEGRVVMKSIVLTVFILFGVTGITQASPVTAVSASGTGSFNNSPDILIDGVIAGEGSLWSAPTSVWWSGVSPSFVIDLGEVYTLQDLLVQVDNNDAYQFDYSTDNSVWSNLFSIQVGYGEISWGMDTMSTDSLSSEYISQLDFAPVDAQFLRVSALGGDNFYSISEIQAFAAPVPEPSMMMLFGLGLMTLMGFNYRRQKQR